MTSEFKKDLIIDAETSTMHDGEQDGDKLLMMINLHVDSITTIRNSALEKSLETINLTSFNRNLPDMLKEFDSIRTQIKAMGDVVLQILKNKHFSEPS